MSDYITLANFCSYANTTTASHSTEASAAITAASRAVDGYCTRTFSANTSSVTARVYRAEWPHRIEVDDFGSTTGLIVATDEGGNGTYGQTWTVTTDYVVEPANLILGGLPWAYNEIRAVGSRFFPTWGVGWNVRDRVQVTAAWGWPATPDAVTQATMILALDIFKMKDTPFGVAGFNEYGVVRIRENKPLQMLLAPYVRHQLKI